MCGLLIQIEIFTCHPHKFVPIIVVAIGSANIILIGLLSHMLFIALRYAVVSWFSKTVMSL